MSIAEVYIKACRKASYYDYSFHYSYENYNLTLRCYSNVSLGVGIWCSILVSKKMLFSSLQKRKRDKHDLKLYYYLKNINFKSLLLLNLLLTLCIFNVYLTLFNTGNLIKYIINLKLYKLFSYYTTCL